MIEDIKRAVEVLRRGGVILYPTDTIWGIGCDATNADAVGRIFKIKQRADSKSMLVLMDTEYRLMQYIREVPEIAWELMEVADKPLTLVYMGAKNLASNLVADDGSIGIRIPKDEFCLKLIAQFKKPLVSTSANISGKPAPAIFHEIDDDIINAVDYAVSWRRNDTHPGQPSSVVKLGLGGQIEILRK